MSNQFLKPDKSDKDNRSNQLNPNNSAYNKSRKEGNSKSSADGYVSHENRDSGDVFFDVETYSDDFEYSDN